MKSAPVRARGKSGSLASKFYSLRSILIEYFPSQEGGGGRREEEEEEGEGEMKLQRELSSSCEAGKRMIVIISADIDHKQNRQETREEESRKISDAELDCFICVA